MIVRDESANIERCLNSVHRLINCWLVVDTGSKDGTQEKVRSLLSALPGSLHERVWVNFEVNRNEALDLAKQTLAPDDWILFMDGDDALVSEAGFGLLSPEYDVYEIEERDNGFTFYRPALVKAGLPWRWVGETHEYLDCAVPATRGRLPGIYRQRGVKPTERVKAKLERDLKILVRTVTESPSDSRAVFYLAQTQKELGMLRNALANYEQRAKMQGWEEEAWWALYEAALLHERLGAPPADVLFAYQVAFERRPNRAEPMYQMARLCREKGWNHMAFLYAARAQQIPRPDGERFFVDEDIYSYKALDEFAVAGYWIGMHRAAIRANEHLLHLVPPGERQRILKNMAFSRAALAAI
jgi:glycosyltransferase involved in cell wall biosynthesis